LITIETVSLPLFEVGPGSSIPRFTDRQSIAPREIEADLILSERLRIRQCDSTYQTSLSFDYEARTSYPLMECIATILAGGERSNLFLQLLKRVSNVLRQRAPAILL
jgi:hypothetical protein